MSIDELATPGFSQRVADALDNPVTVTDPFGTIVWFNRAAADTHGWSRADTLGKPIFDVMPSLAAGGPIDAIRSILSRGESWSGEFVLGRANGSRFPALVTVSPVLDDHGEVIYVVASAMDTSNLRALERRFRSGFDSAPHGWAFAELDGTVTDCNPQYAEIVGRPRDAIIGHDPTEFTYHADMALATPFGAMLQGLRPDTYTTRKRYARRDEEVRWVDVHVQLVRDLDGAPEFFFGLVQDVTDWLEARDKARAAEQSYRSLFHEVVSSIGSALGARDPYTAGHQHRVAALAEAIGNRMGLDPETVEGLRIGASLHDIGKVATPAEILTKPGALDAAERAIIERHSQTGHDIVAGIDFPWPVATMILQHHERLDGSGYPQGLTSDDIIVESRVLAVADTVESITSHRPYRASRTTETALRIINECRGTLFDPDVVDACTSLFESGYTIPQDAALVVSGLAPVPPTT